MQFTFSKNYRFECTQCGECCIQSRISITDSEYEKLTKLVDRSHYDLQEFNLTSKLHLNDISFKDGNCHFLKKINGKRICGIYASRFIPCRLFPLSFSASPNGDLIVNLLHCNGVSLEHGEFVNESYVENAINDINSIDDSFFREHVSNEMSINGGLLPFYTVNENTEFLNKRGFLGRISEWFNKNTLKDKSVEIRLLSIKGALEDYFPNTLREMFIESGLTQLPMTLSNVDIDKLASKIEDGLELRLKNEAIIAELQYKKDLRKILSQGKFVLPVAGQDSATYGLNEKIVFFTPVMDKLEIIAKDLLKEKSLSNEATHTFECYVKEVLNRVGRGGFYMSIPIIDIMESLCNLSFAIKTYAIAYSSKSAMIEKEHINDAIIYVDMRNTIEELCVAVVERAYKISHNPEDQYHTD